MEQSHDLSSGLICLHGRQMLVVWLSGADMCDGLGPERHPRGPSSISSPSWRAQVGQAPCLSVGSRAAHRHTHVQYRGPTKLPRGQNWLQGQPMSASKYRIAYDDMQHSFSWHNLLLPGGAPDDEGEGKATWLYRCTVLFAMPWAAVAARLVLMHGCRLTWSRCQPA